MEVLNKIMTYRKVYNELKLLLVEALVVLRTIQGTNDLCDRIEKTLRTTKL